MAYNRAIYTFILLFGFLYLVIILVTERKILRDTILPTVSLLESHNTSATAQLEPEKCPEGLIRIDDVEVEESARSDRRIPRIVHQIGASRCVTPLFESAMKQWLLPDYSYRFYDDAAMDEFLEKEWPMFPHLHDVLHCIRSKTTKVEELWRHLLLWEYGGVYADMDTVPTGFENNTNFSILPEDDGFFDIDHDGRITQYFMAVSPRHPLMYFAVQHALRKNLALFDLGVLTGPKDPEPHVITAALRNFMQSSKSKLQEYVYKLPHNIIPGVYVGTHNRSVRVVGEKKKETVVKSMNMTDIHEDPKVATNMSCISTIFENVQHLIPDSTGEK